MRNFLIILLFIIAGLISSVMVGFNLESITSEVYYDDEQEGLDDEITIRFSYVTAEDTPKGRTAERFAERVEARTDGQVDVHLYPNAALYNDSNEWHALEEGHVEMIAPATAKVSKHYPSWQVLDLPYAFSNHQAVKAAFTGEIGETLLKELDHTDIKGLGFWYNGFKQITNQKHVIRKPSDFTRLHFRTMPGEVIKEQFSQLNASTSTLTFNKTYQNLEVNFVDGQENTFSNINTKKFHQHQQYLTISNHAYLGYGVLINRTFWDSLPKDIQESIRAAMDEATEWGRRHAIEINDSHIRALRLQQDISIHTLSTDEQHLWEQTLEPVYDKTERVVDDDLMTEINNIREEYGY